MCNKFLDNGTRLAFRQNSQDRFVLSRIKSAFIFSARSWQVAQGHFSILKCKCKSILLAFQRKHISSSGLRSPRQGCCWSFVKNLRWKPVHSLEMTKESTLLSPAERKGHLLISQPRGRSWWSSSEMEEPLSLFPTQSPFLCLCHQLAILSPVHSLAYQPAAAGDSDFSLLCRLQSLGLKGIVFLKIIWLQSP